MRLPLLAVTIAAVLAVLLAPAEASAVTNVQIAGLQVALRAQGLYRGPVDGIAGPATAAAVRAFQRRARIGVDGIAGIQTRKALGPLGRPLLGRRLLVRGAVGWDVSALQFLLRQRGYGGGGLDGRFGPMTHHAVRQFQARAGLPVDGVVGPATLAALSLTGLAPVQAAPPRTFSVRASLDRWAAHYGIDARLVRALAWQESGHQVHVVSVAGAHGVMQVTPATWAFVEQIVVGHRIPRTVDGNIRVGTAFLANLLRRFGGDERLAVAAYYRGPEAVRRYGLGPETRRYVANVLALRGRV